MYTQLCTILYTQTGICTHTFNLKYCTTLYSVLHTHAYTCTCMEKQVSL